LISYTAPSRFAKLLARGNALGSTEKPTLLENLCSATELKITDARDIMYGLMFLAYNWHENDLIADYSMTMSEVFKESMISYLNVYNSVVFLKHANLLSHAPDSLYKGHPSWVPDWTKSCHGAHSTAIEIRRKEESPLIAHVSGNYLYTTGVKISVVYQVYWDLLDSDVGSVSGRKFFDEFRRIIREARFPQDLTSKTRHLSYLLTRQIFSDDLPLDDDRFAEVGDDFQCLSDRILSPKDNDIFSESFLTLDGARHLVRILGTHQQDDWARRMYSHLTRLILTSPSGLHPFVSQTGAMGLAPQSAQPGDEIWFIPTCTNPIALRPLNGNYLVVGRAFLGSGNFWEVFGRTDQHIKEGDEIGGHLVQTVCLQ
jgi:hypothetical protein